jgi:hypothetical protein
MPQTVFVWAEDEDKSGAETGLAALTDDLAVTSGDTIQIPEQYQYIAGVLVGTEFPDYVITDARLSAPGIGGPGVNNMRLHKAYAGSEKLVDTTFVGTRDIEGVIYDYFDNPVKVGEGPNGIGGDTITAYSLEADEAGVAHMNSISLFVTNTRLPIVPHTLTHPDVKFTTAAIAAGLTWEKKTLVLDDDIPTGRYLIWEAELCSATAIAARLVVPGLGYRPAFIPTRTQAEAAPKQPNRCLHPGGIPIEYKGGSLTCKVEFCAETTDTPLSGRLGMQYLGK